MLIWILMLKRTTIIMWPRTLRSPRASLLSCSESGWWRADWRTKVGLVLSGPGGFLSPPLCTWPTASAWSPGQLRGGSCRHAQAQRLQAGSRRAPHNPETDRRKLTQHLLPAGHTSEYITCVSSLIPLGNPMRLIFLLTTLPNGETEALLMLGSAGPPFSDSTTHPIISWIHVCFPSKANKSSNFGFPRYDMNISHVDGQRFGQN